MNETVKHTKAIGEITPANNAGKAQIHVDPTAEIKEKYHQAFENSEKALLAAIMNNLMEGHTMEINTVVKQKPSGDIECKTKVRTKT